MYCPNCGHEIPDEAKYCPDCGSGIFETKWEADNFSKAAQEAKNTVNELKKKAKTKKRKWWMGAIAVAVIAIVIISIAGRQTNAVIKNATTQTAKPFSEYSLVKAIYAAGEMNNDELKADLKSNASKYLSELDGTCWQIAPNEASAYAMAICYKDSVSYEEDHEELYPNANTDSEFLNRLFGWLMRDENGENNIPMDGASDYAYIQLYNLDQLDYYGYEDGYGTYGFYQPMELAAGYGKPIARMVVCCEGHTVSFELKNATSLHLKVSDKATEYLTTEDPIYLNFGDNKDYNLFISSVEPNIDIEACIKEKMELDKARNSAQTNSDYRNYEEANNEFIKKYENENKPASMATEFDKNALLMPVSKKEFQRNDKKAINIDQLAANSHGYSYEIFADMYDRPLFYDFNDEVEDSSASEDEYEYFLFESDGDGIPEIYWHKKTSDEWNIIDCTQEVGYNVTAKTLPGFDEMVRQIGITTYDFSDKSGFKVLKKYQLNNGLIDTSVDYNSIFIKNSNNKHK